MDQEKIGRFLAELRKEKMLTQEQLGQQIGVSNKTVSRWEKGNYLPPADMLKRLSELYGVSINELLSGQRLSEKAYIEKAEENITVIMQDGGFSRRERLAAATWWMRKNWWAVLLCLLPAGMLYATVPFVVSSKLGMAATATSVLLTGVMLLADHLIFHVSGRASREAKADAYKTPEIIRIVWLVILGVMIFICIDLLLALLYSLTPAGTQDGYAVNSMFYDVLIRDGGSYPDNCYAALKSALWQTFLVTVINLDLTVLWVKKR